MNNSVSGLVQKFWIPLLLLSLFLATVIFRPLLPVDETRYLSAAWEMHVRGGWLAPLTVNFQPYHHKPPLLFWLINMSWSVFGISRWAGTVPSILMAGLSVFLTSELADMLFPRRAAQARALPFLMVGSLPFLIYSTLIMFDMTVMVFTLLTLILLVRYGKTGKFYMVPLMALAMGLGVLTKGPVAWLYVVFPMASGPLWLEQRQSALKWYGGCAAALLLSVIPVLFWLIPVLKASSGDFAFWLVWEQTAGRITGNFSAAHTRPVYFYLPLVPALLMPWIFFPSFWAGAKSIGQLWSGEEGARFLICWIVPVFISFSLICGKQPHYLLPLLPGLAMLASLLLKADIRRIALAAILMIFAMIGAEAIVSKTVLKDYDLIPLADYVRAHPGHDWAFAGKYQGEITFLARLNKSIDARESDTLGGWFKDHPGGLAIIRYGRREQAKNYTMLFDMPYRGKRIGIFSELR
jgi:4-amino-4-deoxy-L-arabinose transferase-like glycosyltransferase